MTNRHAQVKPVQRGGDMAVISGSGGRGGEEVGRRPMDPVLQGRAACRAFDLPALFQPCLVDGSVSEAAAVLPHFSKLLHLEPLRTERRRAHPVSQVNRVADGKVEEATGQALAPGAREPKKVGLRARERANPRPRQSFQRSPTKLEADGRRDEYRVAPLNQRGGERNGVLFSEVARGAAVEEQPQASSSSRCSSARVITPKTPRERRAQATVVGGSSSARISTGSWVMPSRET